VCIGPLADLPRVMVDERRIVQVFGNFFSNTARHSPESSPIHVEAVREGIEIAVSVTDESWGIAPERLPHLLSWYADANQGAAAWGRIASLFETAKQNCVEPYTQLKTTLETIAAGHFNSRTDELLAWNFKLPSS